MDYTSVIERQNELVLTEIKNFIPAQVLDNGQCFRWVCLGENRYGGIAHGRRLEVCLSGADLIIKGVTKPEFEATWRDYFDLGRDYGDLRALYSRDSVLNKAVNHSPGLRLMKQEPWETLISFILSQNSNIPRIKGMINKLCECFGADDKFPTADMLAALTEDDLLPIKSGYRVGYIIDAAKKAADGTLDFIKLQSMPTEDIRRELMKIKGVGPKVADCVLLYGFGRTECFPLDVWMKRVMAEFYPNGFPPYIMETAGIAQQFLFHYARRDITSAASSKSAHMA